MKGNVVAYAASVVSVLASMSLLPAACTKAGGDYGQVRLRFEDGWSAAVRSYVTEMPDSNDFILEITGSDGQYVYRGAYGDAPEVVTAPTGSCMISVRSREFSAPEFSAPQYGDDQCIVVPSGGVVDVTLNCRQLNAGIVLDISPDFLTAYPSSWFYVCSDEGRLQYNYTETRIAYFLPGNISVVLNDNSTGESTTLMTRSLAAKEILTVTIGVSTASAASSGEISMQIDTARTWLEETYVIGGENNRGESIETAMSVSEAKASIGSSGVWVYGYIVGGDLTSSATNMSFSAPFNSRTNMAIAAKSSVSEKSSCLSVQLPAGTIRDDLNLVDNPGLLGQQVYLKGDITSTYLGIVGIKNLKDYSLK